MDQLLLAGFLPGAGASAHPREGDSWGVRAAGKDESAEEIHQATASPSRCLGYRFGYSLGTKSLGSGEQKPVAARLLSRSQGLRAFPLFSILNPEHSF